MSSMRQATGGRLRTHSLRANGVERKGSGTGAYRMKSESVPAKVAVEQGKWSRLTKTKLGCGSARLEVSRRVSCALFETGDEEQMNSLDEMGEVLEEEQQTL